MVSERAEFEEGWDKLRKLHGDALSLLGGLDEIGLYQAAAYVSMALDIMRRQHPALDTCEENNRTSD